MPSDPSGIAAADAVVNARHRRDQETSMMVLVSEVSDLKPFAEILTGTLEKALKEPKNSEIQHDLMRQLNMVIQASTRIGDLAAGIRDRQARHVS